MINILVTRPKEDSINFAKNIGDEYNVISSPTMNISKINYTDKDLSQYEALIFTSKRAAKFYQNKNIINKKIFAVGKKTAQTLKHYGCNNVEHTNGDAKDLCNLISSYQYQNKKLLHIRGEDIAYDINANLSYNNIIVDPLIIYKTTEILELTPCIINKFKNRELKFITLYSPKSAHIFTKLIKKYNLNNYLNSIKCLCFSDMVLNSVKDLNWESTHIPEKYEEESIYKLVRDLS